jgi:penicillin-binding protein 2A
VKMRSWIIGFMGIFTLGLFLFIAGYFVIYLNGQKLLMENLEKLDMAEATVVYDRNDEEYGKLFMQNRELVSLEQVPDLLEQAVVATEDQRFDEHGGIDLWAIGRAIVKDIIHRDLVEGGSTITQQLAKNMFLSAEKTFFRKATEVSIALALENNFSKEKILEMYLNQIYFGNGAYGVKAAAERHFGQSNLEELSLLEIAVIAALPKAPETYSPTNNPEKALERAKIVLSLMVDQGYITDEERKAALGDTIGKPAARADKTASAMKDYVLEQASKVTGLSEQELRIGGYHIYTTVDSKAQRAVDKAFANPELFPEDGPEQSAQGAMVIVDPKTGGVAAMNGGRNYAEKGLNRALSDRQPGSSFKPVAVYAPALETGKYEPYSMLKDEKMSFGKYNPRNLNGKYSGSVTMYEAVQRSINLPAVWLLNEIGVDAGLNFAKELGIEMHSEDRNLAIALGGLTKGASPLEMARAYGAFANGGMLAETYVIREVKNAAGGTIYSHEPKASRVMSVKSAYYMTYMLEAVTKKGGTGTKANFGRPVAGKTGTTQLGLEGVKRSKGNRDIWFVGYTPEYAAAVWMGFDDTNKTHYVKSGSGTAAAMFAAVMSEALKDRKARDFTRPEGVAEPKKFELAAVAGLTAMYDAERKEAVLAWSAVPSDVAVEYRLYRKEAAEEAFQLVLSTTTTNVVDITLSEGKTYQYYVTAYAAEREVETKPSNKVDVIVPMPEEGSDELLELPEVLPGENLPAEEEGGEPGTNPTDGEEGGTDGSSSDGGTGTGSNPGAEPPSDGTTPPKEGAEQPPTEEPSVLAPPDGL